MRIIIQFACDTCKRRNYSTRKNKRNTPDRIKLKKYCRWCRSHQGHTEVK